MVAKAERAKGVTVERELASNEVDPLLLSSFVEILQEERDEGLVRPHLLFVIEGMIHLASKFDGRFHSFRT